MKRASFLTVAAALPIGSAFAPSPKSMGSQRRPMKMMVPNGIEHFHNLQHVPSTLIIFPHQEVIAQTSTWIADSSADAAVASATDDSWWVPLFPPSWAERHENTAIVLRKRGLVCGWPTTGPDTRIQMTRHVESREDRHQKLKMNGCLITRPRRRPRPGIVKLEVFQAEVLDLCQE